MRNKLRLSYLHWLARFNLDEILFANDVHSVVIYGAGLYGDFIASELLKNKSMVTLKFVIDQNREVIFPHSIPVYDIDNAPPLGRGDLVILAVAKYMSDDVFRTWLEKRLGCRVLLLSELFINIPHHDIFIHTMKKVHDAGCKIACFHGSDLLWSVHNPSPREALFQVMQAMGRTIEAPELDKDPHIHAMYSQYFYGADDIPGKVQNIEILHDETIRFGEFRSEHTNYVDGHRVTTGNPSKYDQQVFFFGGSITRGYGSSDSGTIASHLQELLTKNPINKKVFKVNNYGLGGFDLKRILLTLENNIRQFSPGDILFFIYPIRDIFNQYYTYLYPFIHFYTWEGVFERPHSFDEVFIDQTHILSNGNKLVAHKCLSIVSDLAQSTPELSHDSSHESTLLQVQLKDEKKCDSIGFSLPKLLENPEFSAFHRLLLTKQRPKTEVVGASVMNCNPFTNGHRYMILQALKQCDHLFIFIVEEERSAFSFKERYDMLRLGVSDLHRVTIIPSGAFVLSQMTFQEYFLKERLVDTVVDPSVDLHIFGAYIAPCLNICKRFAGDEPNCAVTMQYNEGMRRILPQYGVEFIVFDRLADENGAISASRVRDSLRSGDIEELRRLVPLTTYEYLSHRKNHLPFE